jgi:hypothetical protein
MGPGRKALRPNHSDPDDRVERMQILKDLSSLGSRSFNIRGAIGSATRFTEYIQASFISYITI